jgi:fibronectin type 3 domain-containing protein
MSGPELRGMGYAERKAATNVRLAEEAFYDTSERVAALSRPDIADATHGASVVYRDPLGQLFLQEDGPRPLAYAVVSVRRQGQRSALSNIVTLTPAIAPQAPEFLPPILDEGRVCLEWVAPGQNVLFQPVEIGGYRVYRRPLSQEEYDTPLTPQPVEGTSYVDRTAPYGVPLAYTVRATLKSNPKVEGLPAEELVVVPKDTYPPPAPARLDALSEPGLVRLLWNPVDAADLAGYVVDRAEGSGPFVRRTPSPIPDPFFNDTGVQVGVRYRYTVRAVDRTGNESSPSAEAVAEPF